MGESTSSFSGGTNALLRPRGGSGDVRRRRPRALRPRSDGDLNVTRRRRGPGRCSSAWGRDRSTYWGLAAAELFRARASNGHGGRCNGKSERAPEGQRLLLERPLHPPSIVHRRLLLLAREDDEDAQALVAGEAVVGAGRNEGGLTLVQRKGFAFDRQLAATLKDDVKLIVGVRVLMVGLGSNQHVNANLKPR
jgi:hypothetical protein